MSGEGIKPMPAYVPRGDVSRSNDSRSHTISEKSEIEVNETIRQLRDGNKSLETKISKLETLQSLREKNRELNKRMDELVNELANKPNIVYK